MASNSGKKKKASDDFAAITWLDLESWAGSKIVARGKAYQRAGYVKELGQTRTGELLAWVQGSLLYATKVGFEGRSLSSSCSCPYGYNCKHAVAVVLEYLDMLKKGKSPPEVDQKDERLSLIESCEAAEADREDEDFEDFWNEFDEASTRSSTGRYSDKLEGFLRSKSQEGLVGLILEIIHLHPEVKDTLEYKAGLSEGSVSTLVETVSREIDRASSEPGWQDYRESSGYTPDYSRVKLGLQKLLDTGRADEVVALGEKLFRRATRQLSQTDDIGETGCEISGVMSIVFRALGGCSRPDVEKMEWAINIALEDDYGLCDGLEEFWRKGFDKKDWSALADRLLERLNKMEDITEGASIHSTHRRERVTDHIITALDKSGRIKEILPLCKREAWKTHSFVRLVTHLRKARHTEEAEEWARKGIAATREKWPGIAHQLVAQLVDIRTRKRDWPYVAAVKAQEFFENPSLNTFEELRRAARKAGVWTEVRRTALNYLVTGKLPDSSSRQWPLPDTKLRFPGPPLRRHPPFTGVLIDIAIQEKDVDEVLRWYELHSKAHQGLNGWRWGGSIDERVADAIVDKYPERSIAIWKRAAGACISRTTPTAYSTAAGYLRKVKKAMEANGRDNEWEQYLRRLREEHARKRRFLEVLSSISGKPIIDS